MSVMFENRSVDNLLGRLYQPGEVALFEGVLGQDMSNPIPPWAEHGEHGADRKFVPYGVATSMDAPSPDSGEEFTHVNTPEQVPVISAIAGEFATFDRWHCEVPSQTALSPLVG